MDNPAITGATAELGCFADRIEAGFGWSRAHFWLETPEGLPSCRSAVWIKRILPLVDI